MYFISLQEAGKLSCIIHYRDYHKICINWEIQQKDETFRIILTLTKENLQDHIKILAGKSQYLMSHIREHGVYGTYF